MQRIHLEEDLEQIQKYFPGAKAVALRTPFDFSTSSRDRKSQGGILADTFHDNSPRSRWMGDTSWSH
jgi:hypothetical protein